MNTNQHRTWQGCVFIGVSLDGFIARPDGDLTWLTDPEPRAHIADVGEHPAFTWDTFFPTVDALVMGRATYDTVLGFDDWPFAGKHVIVVSTTLASSERAQIARSVDAAAALLDELGVARVYVDGGRTIQSFLTAGLIDEITVSMAPVLLGDGARLFGALDHDVRLTLRGHHASAGDGLVCATYAVEGRR